MGGAGPARILLSLDDRPIFLRYLKQSKSALAPKPTRRDLLKTTATLAATNSGRPDRASDIPV